MFGVCMCLFCVCVVLCLGRGLATSWSLVQGVLPSVKWSWSWKAEARAQGSCRASEKETTFDPFWIIYTSLLKRRPWFLGLSNHPFQLPRLFSVELQDNVCFGEVFKERNRYLSEDNWIPCRYSNSESSECEAGTPSHSMVTFSGLLSSWSISI
jgi:hypothetical protein